MRMTLLAAIMWLAVGVYSLASGLRFRGYLNSLPASSGNRRVRRQRNGFLVFGVCALAFGLWRLFAYFRHQFL